ncbi:hypothetical protein [Desulfacinum hydrothermale]|nr:hypothetical protein [Desulfacinum hydrothermale]
MKPGDTFAVLVTSEQRPKMERVVAHNGGRVLEMEEVEPGSVRMVIAKAP